MRMYHTCLMIAIEVADFWSNARGVLRLSLLGSAETRFSLWRENAGQCAQKKKKSPETVVQLTGRDRTMSTADPVAVEMEEKKQPVAKRRKAKASAAAADPNAKGKSGSKKPTKAEKAELVEATPRSSIESVRYENEEEERGACNC